MADDVLENGQKKLTGGALWIVALLLAAGNFVAVLDMTITNVAVHTIAGDLGVTTSQGTWIITMFSVAEAITMPLTGWLTLRFGAVKIFTGSLFLFGVTSFLCGISNSFNMLLLSRILQGLSAGPMIPLAQTLLMRIFPREKIGTAMGLYAMTTVTAPVAGPILGGWLCENYHWSYAFLINVPLALVFAPTIYGLVKRYETKVEKKTFDFVGLGMLILWVGAFQIMLDDGKDKDWFSSTEIVIYGIVAAIGFVAFMIWELTDKHPVVEVKVFRHPGYTTAVITMLIAFGAFFGINILNPLWLQGYMGYTSTWSGMATAWGGVLAIIAAPIVGIFVRKVDARIMVFSGVAWLALISFIRSFGATNMTYWDISLPILFIGVGTPLFFIPLSTLALESVDPNERESAAGMMAFLRTLVGAIATSVVTTIWDDSIKKNYADLAGTLDPSGSFAQTMSAMGSSAAVTATNYSQLLTSQAAMLATNQTFFGLSILIFIAACTVWLTPKAKDGPPPDMPMGGGH